MKELTKYYATKETGSLYRIKDGITNVFYVNIGSELIEDAFSKYKHFEPQKVFEYTELTEEEYIQLYQKGIKNF